MQEGHPYDLRSRDRAVLDFIRSCDDSSDEMSDSHAELEASGGLATTVSAEEVRATTPRIHAVPRAPNISSEILVLEKELQTLELHKRKMQLLQNIDACKQTIAAMQEKDSPGQSPSTTRAPENHATASGVEPTPNVQPLQGTVDLSNLMNLFPSHVSTAFPQCPSSIKGKVRLVHNYVWLDPIMQQEKDDLLTLTNTGVKINKKLDRDYYKLSIEQWGYGNAAIMQEMIINQELDDQGVRDYLEYTKYINRLFNKYVKGSVLLFDREYRELQFKEKFRWGVSRPHLQDFQLISKPNSLTMQTLQGSLGTNAKKEGTSKQKGSRRGPFTPDGKEICRKFNMETCDFTNCKLQHCCFVCYSQTHNALSHPKN